LFGFFFPSSTGCLAVTTGNPSLVRVRSAGASVEEKTLALPAELQRGRQMPQIAVGHARNPNY